MPESVYLFDTNVIAVLIRNRDEKLAQRIQQVQPQGLILPEPVIHEIERGLLHRGASVRLRYFHEIVAPQYNIVPVQLADWAPSSASSRAAFSARELRPSTGARPTGYPFD